LLRCVGTDRVGEDGPGAAEALGVSEEEKADLAARIGRRMGGG
jgi:hypothetical protein